MVPAHMNKVKIVLHYCDLLLPQHSLSAVVTQHCCSNCCNRCICNCYTGNQL